MGNCLTTNSSSKDAESDLVLELTEIPVIDQLYQSAAEPLNTLMSISESLRSATDAFKTSTYTHILTEYTVVDSLYGMLYIFSANIKNVINHISFTLSDDSPYVVLDKDKLPQHVVKIYDNWEALVNVLEETPSKLECLQTQIENLAEEAKEFPSRAQDYCSHNKLGSLEKAKALHAISLNTKKIFHAKTVLLQISETIKMTLESIQQFSRTFQSNVPNIEKIGETARSENLLMPKQIILTYWPDQLRIDRKAVKKEEEECKAEEGKVEAEDC